MKKFIVVLLAVVAAACTPALPLATPPPTMPAWTLLPSWTAQPTYTPYPTNTLYPTYTPPPTATLLPTATPSPPPTATTTPNPTATSTHTSTPTPTVTPAPPTNTPSPSLTPKPSPTPTAGLTKEEIAYRERVQGLFANYSDGALKLDALHKAWHISPYVIYTSWWQIEAAYATALWKQNGEWVRETEVPSSCQAAHQHLLEAAKHFDRSADLFLYGLAEQNDNKILEHVQEFHLASQELFTAMDMLDLD